MLALGSGWDLRRGPATRNDPVEIPSGAMPGIILVTTISWRLLHLCYHETRVDRNENRKERKRYSGCKHPTESKKLSRCQKSGWPVGGAGFFLRCGRGSLRLEPGLRTVECTFNWTTTRVGQDRSRTRRRVGSGSRKPAGEHQCPARTGVGHARRSGFGRTCCF